MFKYFLYGLLIAPLLLVGQSITYGTLGGGLDGNNVRCLYYDTIDKKLYASGHFKYAENKIVWGAAVWNGIKWDSLAGGLTQYPQNTGGSSYSLNFIFKMARYKNKLYCVGGFDYVNGKPTSEFTIWNGTTWEYPISVLPNWQVQDLIVHDSMLYACGLFTKWGTATCRYIAKFNGTYWQEVGDFTKYCKTELPAQLNTLAFYKNELYVGGLFGDSTGTVRNLAKFDGTNWVNVGTGIQQGGVNSVYDLEVFKNELYIGGRFYETPDIPGNSLVKWDGFSYKPIGYTRLVSGGFPVFKLRASKKYLAVIGNFYKPNEATTYNLFFLDSTKACYINDLDTMYKVGGFATCEYINDSLIVGGEFMQLGNVSAKSVGVINNYDSNTDCSYVSISENELNSSLIIYPNPAKDRLTIEFATSEIPALKIILINSLGQTIINVENLEKRQEIDLSFLSNGIYFLKISNSHEQKVIKFIKE